TGNVTSGKRSVPSRRMPRKPSTSSATVIMTVNTGRRMAIADRFIARSLLLDEWIAVGRFRRRRRHDALVRLEARAHQERAVGRTRVEDVAHALPPVLDDEELVLRARSQ